MAHLRDRFLQNLFNEARQFSPIVGVLGHRQVGKTTFLEKNVPNYLTFDNATTLNLARQDAATFLSGLTTPVAIDETQLCPSLFPALKEAIRKKQRPNQYILSGSVRFTSRKSIQESLTGRITLLEMYPMSIPEIEGIKKSTFISSIDIHNLSSKMKNFTLEKNDKKKWEKYLKTGGLPGFCYLRKESWHSQKMETLISTLLDRDLRMVYPTTLDYPALRNFYSTLSFFQGQPIEITEISKLSGISQITSKKLLAALESLFLIRFLPVLGDRKKRILLFEDVGEAYHLNEGKIKSDYIWLGALFANLRVEFYNQSGSIVQFYQYKKRSGVFAPLVIKRGPNKVWGFFFSGTENPSPKILASVQTFKKEFPESVNFILHNEKKVDLVNSSTVILPIYGIFNS